MAPAPTFQLKGTRQKVHCRRESSRRISPSIFGLDGQLLQIGFLFPKKNNCLFFLSQESSKWSFFQILDSFVKLAVAGDGRAMLAAASRSVERAIGFSHTHRYHHTLNQCDAAFNIYFAATEKGAQFCLSFRALDDRSLKLN